MGEENKKIMKEEVIAKLKDDGDFDKLRLKIVRKLKDNQSAALNCLGSENMKVRELSDAIHDEVGNKVMGKISDSLWEIIRLEGSTRIEIIETVVLIPIIDQEVNPEPQKDNIEQLSIQDEVTVPEEQTQQLQEQVSLGRSTRERRNAIPDDYVVFLQEHEDDNETMEDDPINFHHAMKSSNSQ
ncbi:hypothetical protein V6Z11_D10G181700, partial [Gossypium hirsutum]